MSTQPLRRSLLYVPGNMPSMLQNIPAFPCDVCVIDLEDAVPHREKDAARLLTRRFIESYQSRVTKRFLSASTALTHRIFAMI